MCVICDPKQSYQTILPVPNILLLSSYRRRVWMTLIERHIGATKRFLGRDYYARILEYVPC